MQMRFSARPGPPFIHQSPRNRPCNRLSIQP